MVLMMVRIARTERRLLYKRAKVADLAKKRSSEATNEMHDLDSNLDLFSA